jgi:hypothetical protein
MQFKTHSIRKFLYSIAIVVFSGWNSDLISTKSFGFVATSAMDQHEPNNFDKAGATRFAVEDAATKVCTQGDIVMASPFGQSHVDRILEVQPTANVSGRSKLKQEIDLGLNFVVGHDVNTGRSVSVNTMELNNSHFTALGGSGAGKSRFLLSILQQAYSQGAGITLLDVAGDSVEDFMALITRYVVETGRQSALNQLHYFEPGNPLTSFRIDPFRFRPVSDIHPEFFENLRRAWLHAEADRIGMLVQLKQGQTDFEQNARLQRVLTNIMVAVGTTVDRQGRHLPLSDALVLLTVEHERHNEVFALVEPFLDSSVREDFRRLRSMKRVEDQLRETESTINRLRSIFGPILRSIFGSTGNDEVVDFSRLIRDRQISLWNLRPQQGFSHDQKRTVAQLVIHLTLETLISLPREHRVPHILIIEEAGEVINEEILWALGAMRKMGLSIWILGQDLSTFRKQGKFDLAPKIISQTNLICFNQTWPDDTEVLSRALFTGDLDFSPLLHEHDRPDGYEWHQVTEISVSQSQGANWGEANAEGTSRAEGKQTSNTDSRGTSRTTTDGTSSSSSDGNSSSSGRSTGTSRGTNQSPIVKDYRVLEKFPLTSTGSNISESDSKQVSHSDSSGTSSSFSEGETRGHSRSEGHSLTVSDTETHTHSVGGSEQRSMSRSFKLMPLARNRQETQLSGKLVRAVNDQLEEGRQRLVCLEKRQAVMKLQNHRHSITFQTLTMPDAFMDPDSQLRVIAWAKRHIVSLHPYNFVPDFSPEAEEKRLADFLEATQSDKHINDSSKEKSNPLL